MRGCLLASPDFPSYTFFTHSHANLPPTHAATLREEEEGCTIKKEKCLISYARICVLCKAKRQENHMILGGRHEEEDFSLKKFFLLPLLRRGRRMKNG